MRYPSVSIRTILLVSFLLCNSTVAEEDDKHFEATQEYVKANYTKYEHELVMRDGVKLLTAVYVPKDHSEKYPIILKRTPYGIRPYGSDNFPAEPRGPMKFYAKEKFIFAYQDVRGRNGSEGKFEHVRPHVPGKSGNQTDESTDTYDTVDWLVKYVPHNNGRVGMMGISYPGFYAAAGMIDAHRSLKCVLPQAPVTDWFIGDDFRHNGAFYIAHAFNFLSRFGQPLKKPTRERSIPHDYETPDGYEFYLNFGRLADAQKNHLRPNIEFWQEIIEHDTYDQFWQDRNILTHLKKIKPAVLTVGGWFDAEDCYGPLNVYKSTEKQSPSADNKIVMGPWFHGGWHRANGNHLGHVRFDQDTSIYYRKAIELPFLNYHLKNADDPELAEATMFQTGVNQWRKFEKWPPKNVQKQRWYFHGDGRLSRKRPETSKSESEFDTYVSDPAKPVPFIPSIAIGMTREHMVDDQRFAATRPDVLVYATEPLESDVTIAGPISPKLFVSTSGTASDFVVKLIDVYPGDYPNPDPNPTGVQMGGYQQLVRGEAFRGRFRKSFEKPEPFVPDQMTTIEYVMPDAFHTFRRGHRIMVQVQSTWFPLIDRNPQTYVKIAEAMPEDYQKATQKVFRFGKNLSGVELQILPGN
ncbi:MAG: CocE/NonD family hydrolase [Planctomycetota bacterium]